MLRDRRYVLYWMQASQRAEYNHALEYAIGRANQLNKPLIVFFGITDSFPDANERHYFFMLEGLKKTQKALEERGIRMVIRHRSPEQAIRSLARLAALVVTDRGYLRIERGWRTSVAEVIDSPLIEVETDVIVPVETACDSEQYAARTIRPRIHERLQDFMLPIRRTRPKVTSLNIDLPTFSIKDVARAVSKLKIDRSVPRVETFGGGTSNARKLLAEFIDRKLANYAENRNDPTLDGLSHMSPYLHFGQISPLFVALEVSKKPGPGAEAYLEELIVRRELSMNFVHYNPQYDVFDGLPDWAKNELKQHAKDHREYSYSLEQWENAQTHDPYWNAAQNEMRCTGKMHGYMRMYWGKKILQWTDDPEEAYGTAVYLNNKYELDGRDPNGFAGVAWCFGKHDRAWPGRPVFGKIRYMSASGLRRKFDADAYVKRVSELCSQVRVAS